MTLTTTDATETAGRAARLKSATQSAHARLDAKVMAARPFEDTERYRRFVEMQYRFMAAVDPLYRDMELGRHLPDLKERSRFEAVRDDLVDLGAEPPESDPLALSGPEALGWLYVAEGSNLGAAFLANEARRLGYGEGFGARHLAGHPAGRGLHWRQFKDALDRIPLNEAEELEAIAGATAAFAYVEKLADSIFQGLAAPRVAAEASASESAPAP